MFITSAIAVKPRDNHMTLLVIDPEATHKLACAHMLNNLRIASPLGLNCVYGPVCGPIKLKVERVRNHL